MEITRTTLGIAVGIAGTLFLGYCVYFDQQRRKDPLFKKSSGNLSRKCMFTHANNITGRQNASKNASQGHTLGGDLEAGVEHLGQAVAVCGQTQQLLGVLQQTMPAPIFHLLLKKLPEVSERLRASMKASGGSMLQEEDVE
ncbi:hypothetical protein MSG28_015557 [Choristoneura fumiferana]|uniref:Uncharacterized protein n=1 Tax=Choristoneura fumiferana TaxID=7141 RepID=A0ACC0KAM1_CHOFU|nr:hypothetical protein MSG28_015557 [Choristoneura fumiferana]